MPITFNNNKFHLFNDNISYIMEVSEYKDILHMYWGKRIDDDISSYPRRPRAAFSPVEGHDEGYSLDVLPQEYPMYGAPDLRTPACDIELINGCIISKPRYKSYEIISGKPNLKGLPSVYTESDDEAQTLKIILEDEKSGFQIHLYYTIFENMNVICRHTEIKNTDNLYVYVKSAMSMNIDFHSRDYKYMHLSGAWTREKHVAIEDVSRGYQGIESKRGASGHNENPFIAIMDKNATEDFGNVYGLSLIYSGNYKMNIEVDQYETMRVQAGINPYNFKWKLEENETFVTPETVLVYSDEGIGGMSRTFHKLYRTRLCKGEHRDKVRPILINNWEGTYFDFNEEKLLAIADNAQKMGLELFVLDDGWFGKRNDDTTSLGDWFVNEEKLPHGINYLAEEMNKRNLKFGLWFEPEMISPKSKLYEQHPEWAISVPGRVGHLGRNQYILNLSREDVCEYIIDTLSQILSNANIEYVKWDMNRNMTDMYAPLELPDKQGEMCHKYILGLYKILDTLTSRFPNILFEGCSGGGGRNDPAMLYYMPQNWTSDDTDAIERLYIQYGASMVYPASTMGAHVSAVPNHQVGRTTPLKLRGTVAMSGMFGYELDLSKLDEEETKEMSKQVEQYKRIREIVTMGDLYRLLNPFEGRSSAWMYVTEDKDKAVVFYANKLAVPNAPLRRLKLKGLDPNKTYKIGETTYSGSTLMNFGLNLPEFEQDFESCIWEIENIQ